MPVTFQLEPGKPPTTFTFSVDAADKYEQLGGANPAHLAMAGKQVTACVLLLMFCRLHIDPNPTQKRAERLLQRYLDGGGKVHALMDALAQSVKESGVYGDPDDPPSDEDEQNDDGPTKATTGSL